MYTFYTIQHIADIQCWGAWGKGPGISGDRGKGPRALANGKGPEACGVGPGALARGKVILLPAGYKIVFHKHGGI